MPEPPDFEQIAHKLHDTFGCDHGTDAETVAAQVAMIIEQLRQVWNARGAADLAKLAETYRFTSEMDTNAIRSLDR
jgi:hypothetical protein